MPCSIIPGPRARTVIAFLLVLGGSLACAKSRLDESDERQVAQTRAVTLTESAGGEVPQEADESRRLSEQTGALVGSGSAASPAGVATTPDPAPAPPPAARRLVVYHGWLRLAVHLAEEVLRAVDDLTEKLGGYVESSSLTQRVVRVPAERYDEAVTELRKLGEVRDFRQRTWDITEQYRNLEVRIGNLRVLHARYEALLAEARTMQDRLAIEQELRRIAQELRVLEEQRRYLADQAAFATLTVDVETIQPRTVVRNRPPQPFEWVTRYGLGALLGS